MYNSTDNHNAFIAQCVGHEPVSLYGNRDGSVGHCQYNRLYAGLATINNATRVRACDAERIWGRVTFVALPLIYLYIKPKLHHVVWLHDVGFALGADFA